MLTHRYKLVRIGAQVKNNLQPLCLDNAFVLIERDPIEENPLSLKTKRGPPKVNPTQRLIL